MRNEQKLVIVALATMLVLGAVFVAAIVYITSAFNLKGDPVVAVFLPVAAFFVWAWLFILIAGKLKQLFPPSGGGEVMDPVWRVVAIVLLALALASVAMVIIPMFSINETIAIMATCLLAIATIDTIATAVLAHIKKLRKHS